MEATYTASRSMETGSAAARLGHSAVAQTIRVEATGNVDGRGSFAVNEHIANTAIDLLLSTIPQAANVVRLIRRFDRDLAYRLRCAITSVALQLAQADASRGDTRRVRLEAAYRAAREAKAVLDVSIALDYVTNDEAGDLLSVVDRTGARIWNRMRSTT